MNRSTSINVAVFVFLVVLGATARIASKEFQTWNFTPLASVALFAGFYFSSVAVAAIVPIAVMTISNAWLYGDKPLFGYDAWQMLVVVYAALLLPLLFRWLLRSHLSAPRVILGAVGSALMFFLVTNFAHWYFVDQTKTLADTFADAIPFLRGTLIGDLVFSAILFGGYALANQGRTADTPVTVPVRR